MIISIGTNKYWTASCFRFPKLTGGVIAIDLHALGVKVWQDTACRRPREENPWGYTCRGKPLICTKNRKARLKFATKKKVQKWAWWVFGKKPNGHETKLNLLERWKGESVEKDRDCSKTVAYYLTSSSRACMTASGISSMVFVEDVTSDDGYRLTAEVYRNNTVRQNIQRNATKLDGRMFSPQDNNPKHTKLVMPMSHRLNAVIKRNE